MMARLPYARVVALQSLLDLGGFLVHMQCKEGDAAATLLPLSALSSLGILF